MSGFVFCIRTLDFRTLDFWIRIPSRGDSDGIESERPTFRVDGVDSVRLFVQKVVDVVYHGTPLPLCFGWNGEKVGRGKRAARQRRTYYTCDRTIPVYQLYVLIELGSGCGISRRNSTTTHPAPAPHETKGWGCGQRLSEPFRFSTVVAQHNSVRSSLNADSTEPLLRSHRSRSDASPLRAVT